MLYFAYGSNLNKEQMARRCPAAVPIGKLMLPNYRLVFRTVCDVVPEKGATCPGALWRITEECEEALDRYEGVSGGMYRKEYIKVKGHKELVMLYRMNSVGIYPPSVGYYNSVRDGYKDFGLKLKPLLAALMHSYEAKAPSHVERKRARRNGRPKLKPYPGEGKKITAIQGQPVEQKYDSLTERKVKNLDDWLRERRSNRYRPVNE